MPGAEVAVPRAGEPRGVAVWLAPGSLDLGPDAFGEPGLVGCIALVGRNPPPLCTPHSCRACPAVSQGLPAGPGRPGAPGAGVSCSGGVSTRTSEAPPTPPPRPGQGVTLLGQSQAPPHREVHTLSQTGLGKAETWVRRSRGGGGRHQGQREIPGPTLGGFYRAPLPTSAAPTS